MSKIVKIDFNRREETRKILETVRAVLESKRVIAFPTDTFYGLGVNPMDEEAVAGIFIIKRRPSHKPLLVLVASLKQLDSLIGEITPDAKKLIRSLWPGALTLLFKASPRLPKNLTAGSGKIGVRLPANDFTLKFIESIGHPLTAPSANISGAENIRTAQGVHRALGSKIGLIVNGGPAPGEKESTVLDTTLSPPEILREGEVSKEQIETVLKKTVKCSAPSAFSNRRLAKIDG